jgi:hypothetical protein
MTLHAEELKSVMKTENERFEEICEFYNEKAFKLFKVADLAA